MMDTEHSDRFKCVETRMGGVETDVAVIRSNYATKADFALARVDIANEFGKVNANIIQLESALLKWFVATVLAAITLSVSIARLTH